MRLIALSRSWRWRSIRQAFLKDNPSCAACSSIKNLQVHHIIPVSIDKSKELDYNNLITLCKNCHFVFGHLMDWNSWNKDVIDDSKVYNNKIINKPLNIKGQFYEKSTIGDYLYSFVNSFLCWYYRS